MVTIEIRVFGLQGIEKCKELYLPKVNVYYLV